MAAAKKTGGGFWSCHHRYVAETRRRMTLAVETLQARGLSPLESRRDLCGRLREQEAASRGAGFASIACLCRMLNDCLALNRLRGPLGGGSCRPAPSLVAALSEACRVIELHAVAVEKTESYLRSGLRYADEK
jgi:hypothetical protein